MTFSVIEGLARFTGGALGFAALLCRQPVGFALLLSFKPLWREFGPGLSLAAAASSLARAAADFSASDCALVAAAAAAASPALAANISSAESRSINESYLAPMASVETMIARS